MTLDMVNKVLELCGIDKRIVRPTTAAEREALSADPNVIVADPGEAGLMVALATLRGQRPTADNTTNEWKETVRSIFDQLHFGKQSVFNNDLARYIVAMIEVRHHAYFCEGKTMKEWENG